MTIDLEMLLWVCGGIVTVAGAIGVLSTFFKKQIKQITKEEIKTLLKETEENVTKKVEDLHEYVDGFVKESRENDEKQKRVIVANARARINDSYCHFTQKGSISHYTMSILEDIYEEYTSLGGNHLAKEQMEALRELPKEKSEV